MTAVGPGRRDAGQRGRLKVVYVIGALDVGGAEGQLIALAQGLDSARFEPVIVCLAQAGALAGRIERGRVRLESVALRGLSPWRQPGQILARFGRLVRFLRRERPDVVHGFLFHGYVLGTAVARLCRVPVVVQSRRSLGIFKAGRPHYVALERLATRFTDMVVANSEGVREDAIRREGLPRGKTLVIYNGVDAHAVVPPDPDLVKALEGARPVVGVVANLIGYKGHRFFLEAWSTVLRAHPAAVALLVGDGPLRAELEALVRERGLGASVRFLGARPDVTAILSLVDLVVHPSLQEGFSNAILEAMAAGKPVVATAVGGSPEAIADGETGLLVPPEDSAALAGAMLRLLGEPGTAARMGEAARRRAATEFGMARMVEQYEALYERLVSA